MKSSKRVVVPIILTVWAVISFVTQTNLQPDVGGQVELVIESINLWVIASGFVMIIVGSLWYIYRKFFGNNDQPKMPKILMWGLIVFFYMLAVKTAIAPFEETFCC